MSGVQFRVVVAVWLVWLVALAPRPASADVLVAAASSLTDVLGRIGAAFERQGGERIVLNTGASNTLARQILAGAPVDVFISADEAQMDVVAGEVVAGTRRPLLGNALALGVARGGSRVQTPRDLVLPGIRRIAIADPAAVPAGVYARQFLESHGLWTLVQAKLVFFGSVRLALAAVEAGAADVALVYRTDLLGRPGVTTGFVVPVGDGPRIRYPVARIRAGRNQPGAQRFVRFLEGASARQIFTDAGFVVLASGTGAP